MAKKQFKQKSNEEGNSFWRGFIAFIIMVVVAIVLVNAISGANNTNSTTSTSGFNRPSTNTEIIYPGISSSSAEESKQDPVVLERGHRYKFQVDKLEDILPDDFNFYLYADGIDLIDYEIADENTSSSEDSYFFITPYSVSLKENDKTTYFDINHSMEFDFNYQAVAMDDVSEDSEILNEIASEISTACSIVKKQHAVIDINIENNEILYNDELPIVNVTKGAEYTISYSSEDLEIEDATSPTQEGHWTLKVNVIEDVNFYADSEEREFELKFTNIDENLLIPKGDAWGYGGSSVITRSNNMKYVTNENYSYWTGSLKSSGDDITSAYMLSNYYYTAEGSFSIKAKNNIDDFGTFAFWLTTCDGNGESTGGEYTIEVLKNHQVILGYIDIDKNYKSTTITLDYDLCDNKYHDYKIVLEEGTPCMKFVIDNNEYSIPENLIAPTTLSSDINSEYVKVNVGLLYPQFPAWTGEAHGNKMPSYSVTEAQFLNADGSTK